MKATCCTTETAEGEVLEEVAKLVASKSFFRKHVGAQSPLIRQHAYQLIEGILERAPRALDGCVKEMAPHIIGAIGEKDPACHKSMWSMVLQFIQVRTGNNSASPFETKLAYFRSALKTYVMSRDNCEILGTVLQWVRFFCLFDPNLTYWDCSVNPCFTLLLQSICFA